MAQLTDDFFTFSGPLLPVDEVERIIDERISPVSEIEVVALRAAPGRILAADLIAPMDLPPSAVMAEARPASIQVAQQ